MWTVLYHEYFTKSIKIHLGLIEPRRLSARGALLGPPHLVDPWAPWLALGPLAPARLEGPCSANVLLAPYAPCSAVGAWSAQCLGCPVDPLSFGFGVRANRIYCSKDNGTTSVREMQIIPRRSDKIKP